MFLLYDVSSKINWYAWWKFEINDWIKSDSRMKTLIILEVIFYRWLSHDECLNDWTKSDAQQYEEKLWFQVFSLQKRMLLIKKIVFILILKQSTKIYY